MKERIVWKFLGAYTPLILFAIIILNFFVSFNLRIRFVEKITDRLYSNALLVSHILKDDLANNKNNAIQEQVKQLGSELNLRVTIINNDGVVLGDSQEDPKNMDIHNNRPEIAEALQQGKGESLRFSDTLNYKMKYLAVRVKEDNKTIGVVRLAISLNEVDKQIRVIYQAVLLSGIVAAILTVITGYFISRSITTPISEMKDIAKRISDGDFSRKIVLRSKDELGSLAHSLNTMADKLQNQIEHLKAMDKEKTDFVANVSHELKTPLTSIKGYVETLEDGALNDKKNARRFLSIIKKHTDSITNIVNDLLSLSETDLGKKRLRKENFSLRMLLDDVILGFGHALKKKNLTIKIAIINDDFLIFADKGKIEQVFVNLIDNAVKYSNNGGNIIVSLTDQEKTYTVSITDNGIGIAENDILRVFERFYRVDKARSRDLGGTGLGLAIVQHITSLHNGKIDIKSEPNKGTCASVTLPKA